jgi:hypothetical protein
MLYGKLLTWANGEFAASAAVAAEACDALVDSLSAVVQPIMPAAAVNINPHSVIRRVETCISSPWVGTGYYFFDETFYASIQAPGNHALF